MPEPSNTSARLVPAVDRAARILALLESASRPMGISQLARELDASKGTVRDILETLRRHGFLDRDEHSKLYRLGPGLVRLGEAARESQDLVVAAAPHLADLCEVQREIVLLLVRQGDRFLIQDAVEPSNPRTPILVSATPGHTIPLTAGACGKVLLAWSSDELRASLQEDESDAVGHPPDELDRVREQGFAIDDQGFMEGVRGISSPIVDARGRLAGVVLLSGVVSSLGRERFQNVGAAVRETASAISRAIGGSGFTDPVVTGAATEPRHQHGDGSPDAEHD